MIILVINGLIGLVFGTIVVFFIAGYIVPYSLIIIPFAIYTGITIR